MRRPLVAALASLAGFAGIAGTALAQDTTITIRPGRRAAGAAGEERLAVRELPRDVAEEVIRFFNGPGTLHFSGSTRIPPTRGIDGDVAILGGPVMIGGRVSGALVVVNGDVIFERGAVVGGDVIVVGGSIEGAEEADIAGEIRSYRDPLRYRRQGDQLVYAPTRDIRPEWIKRQQYGGSYQGTSSEFFVALGGSYNRVEGAGVQFGPRVDARLGDGLRFQTDLIGILRTGRDFSLRSGDFGYRTRAEFQFGARQDNIALGARAYDIIQSVEPWPFKDYEAGWAALLLHSDYRDYYRRHGGGLYTTLNLGRSFSVTAEGRDERQMSVEVRDPWTLFHNDRAWRENPSITDGRYRSAVGSLRLDTRNDRGEPSSGLFVTGEYELGEGTDVSNAYGQGPCPLFGPCPPPPGLEDGKLTYQRIFFDARSYTRISPAGRLNLRLAGGGWVGGDPLPLQRRFSLGYPDPLPGYAFRQFACGGEQVAGAPALCDRVLIAQAEFRSHLGFDFGPDWANDWGDGRDHYEPFHVSGPDVVVFADAGRAWLTGSAPGQIPSDKLPKLGSFHSDLGLGLDFGPVGLYFAKALDEDRSVTFSVRMGRRF